MRRPAPAGNSSPAHEHPESGAAALLTLHLDTPSVFVHDALDHREANSHATRTGGEKCIEQSALGVRADAGPVVVDLQHGCAIRFALALSAIAGNADQHLGSRAARLDRVTDQVPHDLPELAGVGPGN